jgi:hypothetical protein
MALHQTTANAILSGVLHLTTGTVTVGGVTITAPNKIRLMTVQGSATATGTELGTGGSYVSQAATPATGGISIGTNWAAASAGSQATNAIVQQTNMPVATIVGIEIWDSNTTTPVRLEYTTSFTSKSTAAGDTLSFASGAITSALA